MSESKRNLKDTNFEELIIKKKIKLNDDYLASSSSYSSSDSEALSDHRSSSVTSEDCRSDEKVNQISTLTNFRKQVSEMDSATTEKKKKDMKKAPTKAEIDDFFSVAEEYEQKRFSEKYNYDIVNDTPLEGRYQWVALKQ